MALDHLPNALLLLSEGGVLGRDLRLVLDLQLLSVVLKYFNVAVVELFTVGFDKRTRRCSEDGHHEGDVVALDLDVERDADGTEDLSAQRDVDDLRALGVDNTAFLVRRVDRDSLGLIVLGNYLVLGLEVIFIDDLNLSGLRMAQEASIVLKEVNGVNPDFGNKALSLDGDSEHILSYSFQVDHEDHIVLRGKTGDEFNVDLGFLEAFEPPSVVGYVEFRLQTPAVARDSDHVVDVDLRGVSEIDRLLDWELVGNTTKIDDFLRELEGGGHYVTLER
mmetsp:Transcript_39618/g.60629  ORF Transcript_39618/g.60629 Transcript_39618/m.60629 type:complete len:277 (+) Transcript_39618:11747-12577(+)